MGRSQNKATGPASPRKTGRRGVKGEPMARGDENGEPEEALEEPKEEQEREEQVQRRTGVRRTGATRRRGGEEEDESNEGEAVGDVDSEPKPEEEYAPPPKKKQSHGVASDGSVRTRSGGGRRQQIDGAAVFTNFWTPPSAESIIAYQPPEALSGPEPWVSEKSNLGKPLVFRSGWPKGVKGELTEFQTIDFDFQATSSRHEQIEFRPGLPKSLIRSIEAKQDAQHAEAAASASQGNHHHQQQQLAHSSQNSSHPSPNDRSAASHSPTMAESGENPPVSPNNASGTEMASGVTLSGSNGVNMAWQEHVVTMTSDDSRTYHASAQNSQPMFVSVFPGEMSGLSGSGVIPAPTKFNFINMDSPYTFAYATDRNGAGRNASRRNHAAATSASTGPSASSSASASHSSSSATHSHDSSEIPHDATDASTAAVLEEGEPLAANHHMHLPVPPISTRGRRKSAIWQFFAQENGKQVCQHCPPDRSSNVGSFSLTTTTRTLRKHLKSHHPELDIPPVASTNASGLNSSITEE